MVYYDLWHGVELKPVVNNGTAALAFSIEGNGYGDQLPADGHA
jgi:hypothetical protein